MQADLSLGRGEAEALVSKIKAFRRRGICGFAACYVGWLRLPVDRRQTANLILTAPEARASGAVRMRKKDSNLARKGGALPQSGAAEPQCPLNLDGSEAEAIALAIKEKAQVLGIDDKNGINASKLLGIPFTAAAGILVRSRERGLLNYNEALAKLTALAKYGRYKPTIIEDARRNLEARK